MATDTRGRDYTLSSLNAAIDVLNLAEEATGVTPAEAAFTSASALLALIRVRFLPIDVGRLPINVCRTRRSTKWTTSNWG